MTLLGDDYEVTHIGFIEAFEMRHRVAPVSRSTPATAMRKAALDYPEYGLTLLNYALWVGREHHEYFQAMAVELEQILAASGSVWEVTSGEEPNRWRLTRRDLAGTREAIAALPAGERASEMLQSAWVKLASRDPDPSGAYDLSVKAVEAAAHPVVSPNREKATLGSMLGDMLAQPERWSFVLEDFDTVLSMASTLWTKHYRHGTQRRDGHTLGEADTAVHLALALVRFFTGNAVTLTST